MPFLVEFQTDLFKKSVFENLPQPKTEEFYVTENDLDLIDIAGLIDDEEYAELY